MYIDNLSNVTVNFFEMDACKLGMIKIAEIVVFMVRIYLINKYTIKITKFEAIRSTENTTSF